MKKPLYQIFVFVVLSVIPFACTSPNGTGTNPATGLTPTATPTLMLTATSTVTLLLPTPNCSGSTIMGYTTYPETVIPQGYAGGPNTKFVDNIAGAPGTISTLHFYTPNGGSSVLVGVYSYSSSNPLGIGSLLSSSNTVSAVAGWNSVSLNNPVAVTHGDNYWLSLYNNPSLTMGGAENNASYIVQQGTSGPTSLATGWVAFYADICPSTSSTSPTPTNTPCPTIFGNTQNGTSQGIDTFPRMFLSPFQAASSVVVGNLSIFGAGGQYALGIYSDSGGQPVSLLAETGPQTASDPAGWSEAALNQPVTLSSGVTYWLAEHPINESWTTANAGAVYDVVNLASNSITNLLPNLTGYGPYPSTGNVYCLYASSCP